MTLHRFQNRPRAYKTFFFLCSTKLSTKFILLINVKMPTIAGILTFISRINASYESLKARNFVSFSVELSMKKVL